MGVSVMTVFVLIRSFIIEFKNDTGLILKYIYSYFKIDLVSKY